jgi:hypothetical protein
MKVDSATMLSDLHLHDLILEGSTTFLNSRSTSHDRLK